MSFSLVRPGGFGIKTDMAKVTVDLDLVDLALGVLCIAVNAAMLSHFRKHMPERRGLRLLCVFGMIGGAGLAFGKFFYHLGLGR